MDKKLTLVRNLGGVTTVEELASQLGDIFSRIEDYLSAQVNVYWFPNPRQPLPTMNDGDMVFTVVNGVVTLQLWDGQTLSPFSLEGPAGPAGADGLPGIGVPAGGSGGFVLAKSTSTDYDTSWVNPEKLFPDGAFHEIMSSGLPDPEVVFDGVTGDVMLGYIG